MKSITNLSSSVITLLSKYSLGIFATHKYWYLFVTLGFIHFRLIDPRLYASNFALDLQALNIAVISISLTFIAVLFTGNTFIKRLIS